MTYFIAWVIWFLVLASAASAQEKPPLPPYSDQLYMIGRAQEQEIERLRQQLDDARKQIEALKTQPPASPAK